MVSCRELLTCGTRQGISKFMMVMRRLKIISNVRPFLPVIIGLSLGFSMSIVRMPILHEDCVFVSEEHIDRKLNSLNGPKDIKFFPENGLPNLEFKAMSKEEAVAYRKDREYAPAVYDSLEDFEPRIITDPELKPKVDINLEANKKKIVRTRYISTELGIREKLVSSVITSRDTYLTMAVAMNKTFSHHMQKVIFFDGMTEANQEPLAAPGMTLISHPDNSAVRILAQTLTYLHLKFKSEYDWYFLTTDSTYSQADRINYIVDHISINRRLYLGKPNSYNDRLGVVNYCNMDSGFIISRLLLIDIVPNIESCLQDSSPDISAGKWLGRCIKRATSGAVECVDEEEGIFYRSFHIDNPEMNIEGETSAEFESAVTVSGVTSPQIMFELHKRFAQLEIDKAYKEIGEIQEEIKALAPKLPEGERELSWPIGINPQFKPTNRWDIIVWDYFTEEYTLTCPGEVPKCDLSGVDKLDIQNILQIALDRLNEKYNPQGLVLEKRKLINGYRRFDPQRGMEYILDLLLTVIIENENQEVELSHRVNMLRPLSQVEIIPMPYVTESAKVHVILPLTKQERVYFEAFMDKYAKICLNNDENVALNIVFVYDPETAERIHQDDIFSEQKQLLQTYETRYKKEGKSDAKLIPWVSIKTEVPSQLKIMDIVAKKYPTDTLFLLASVAANMNTNFLNRCRMNAIPGWQAFFPIPFSQYNPEIIFKNGQVPDQIDIKPNNGHFDLYSFDEVCIYNSDYMTSRTKMAASVSTEDSKESLSELVDTLEVYDVLIKYSQLHVFRAVEPHLTRRYVHRNCNHRNGQEIFDRCDRSNAEGLASRTQLAMELFPDEPKKN